ncbi:MAG: hypothetical protein NC346_02455 [Prevotella sp.]|nr:hypothetical protein [Bacteroidales bacterium]MCM1068735.1 hypothetical protein [Prevotella sp.]
MTKSEIFSTILHAVADVCEVTPEQILSKSKESDVSDARCIFVYHCVHYGLPIHSIAKYLHRKRNSSVHAYLATYQAYHKQYVSFRLLCRNVSDKLSQCIFENS